ncbi:MAG: antibiotic biosynthesis monooxygenase [Chloroflexi bacterium]|nr:antibiotic biosynthesis monooxygenase [Chloroflexota bacterium]
MFIAMNQFKVAPGKEQDFETIWKTRETHLNGVPGFVRFSLLKGDSEGDYISHSTWESRDAFVAWTQSENFVQGHRQGGLMGVLQGPPQVRLYEAVVSQDAVPA